MAYNPALNHVDVLSAAKADLFGPGNPALTADQCVALCNEAARRFITMGEVDAGLNLKSSGNHGIGADGKGYSVDVIVYRDSAVYVDCLKDAGDSTAPPPGLGAATPIWPAPKPANTATWAPPFGSPTGPEPPEPPDPEPPPGSDPLTDILAVLEQSLQTQARQLAVLQELLKAVDEVEDLVREVRRRLDTAIPVKIAWK